MTRTYRLSRHIQWQLRDSSSSVDKVTLLIIKVKVTNPKHPQEKRTVIYTLLDYGSTRAFCAARVTNMLGVEGHHIAITVNTLTHERVKQAKEMGIVVKGALAIWRLHILLSRVIVLTI